MQHTAQTLKYTRFLSENVRIIEKEDRQKIVNAVQREMVTH